MSSTSTIAAEEANKLGESAGPQKHKETLHTMEQSLFDYIKAMNGNPRLKSIAITEIEKGIMAAVKAAFN